MIKTLAILADFPTASTGFAVVCNNLARQLSKKSKLRVVYFGRFGLKEEGTIAPEEKTELYRGYEYIPCVTQNTYMLEELHISNVKQMIIGNKVLGSMGKQIKITEKFERDYEGKVITIKGEGLLSFGTTPEHEIKFTNRTYNRKDHESPFYIFETPDFKPARFFTNHDFLIFPKFKEISNQTEINMEKYNIHRRGGGKRKCLPKIIKINEQLMAISGLYLAEGSPFYSSETHYPSGIKFSYGIHEERLAKLTVDLINDIWGLESKMVPDYKNNSLIVRVISTQLSEFFIESFGCGAKNKRIPQYVMLASKELVKPFTLYYLFGDGNEKNSNRKGDYKSLRFTTVSVAIALQLQQLLSKIDIFAHIDFYKPPEKRIIQGRICNQSPKYLINISGIQISKLGFEVKERRKLNRIGETEDEFFIPVRKIICSNYKGKVFNFKTEDNTYQVSNVIIHNCEGGVWKKSTVREIIETYNVDLLFSEDDWFSAQGLVDACGDAGIPFHFHTPIDSLPIDKKAFKLFEKCTKVYIPNSSYRLIPNGIYLPHGVNPLMFQPLTKTQKRLFNNFTFLWIGRNEARKAMGRAIMAFKQVCGKVPCQMVIRSDWTTDWGIKTGTYLSNRLSLPIIRDQMRDVEHGYLQQIYANCDVLVITSKAGGFELQSIEAMACGLPVICVKGNAYMLESNKASMVAKVIVGTSIPNDVGSIQTIKNKFERDYDGEVITIKGRGLLPFSVTPEHPIEIVEKHSKTYSSLPTYRREYSPKMWILADLLKTRRKEENVAGHYEDCLVFPKHKEETDEYLNTELNIPINKDIAYIFGLWLAEGWSKYMRGWGGKVFWSFNSNEMKLAEKVKEVLQKCFNKKSNMRINEHNSLVIETSCSPLAKFLANNFGLGAYNKRIPSFIMNAPKEIIKSFILGYLHGDGNTDCINGGDKARFTTVSPHVVLQLQKLFSKLDIFASVFVSERNVTKEHYYKGKKIQGNYPIFTITIYRKGMDKMGLVTRKVKENHTYIDEDENNFYIPIRKITREHYKGKVYNFETEDHTYQVSNIVVHNCTDFPFMNEQIIDGKNGFRIPIESVERDPMGYGRLWGNIDTNFLTKIMVWCFLNPEKVKAMGTWARQYVIEKYNWEAIAGVLYKEMGFDGGDKSEEKDV